MTIASISLESCHRFHSYSARFPSEIVEDAIHKYTEPGDSVFDPFCGSGTTLVTALAHKRKAIGIDIDILAGMLSAVKCFPLPYEEYAIWREEILSKIDRAFGEISTAWKLKRPSLKPGTIQQIGDLKLYIPALPQINYWFPPQVIVALASIADIAHEYKGTHFEQVALISLSASIIAKWPNTLSYAMDIDHTRPHRKIQRFTLERVREIYVRRLDRTLANLGKLYEAYKNAGIIDSLDEYAHVHCPYDAREPLMFIPDNSQALVVTSPPYFNAVDYPRSHRLSVCWMNGHAPEDLSDRRSYIGLRGTSGFDYIEWFKQHAQIQERIPEEIILDASTTRRLGAFFDDLKTVLKHIFQSLRPGGHAVFVIGNNVIKGQRIESSEILSTLAEIIGFEEIRVDSREIARLRRRFPVGPFGFNGPMTHEYVVVMHKPLAVIDWK